MIKDLITNIAIFSSIIFFYNSLVPIDWAGNRKASAKRVLAQGIVMGILGNVLMFFSVHVNATTIVDYRQLAVICAALFGGIFSSLIASVLIGIGRVLIFGGFNSSSLIGVASILSTGLISGLIVSRIYKYRNRWILFVITMIATTTIAFFLILGSKSMKILPYFFIVLVIGSCFVAYLLRYLVKTNIQQHLVKENEKRFRNLSSLKDAVFNSASEVSITVTDSEGVFTLFNQGAERMLGYTEAEMVGKETPLIIHLESEVQRRGEELSALFNKEIQGFDILVEWTRHGKADEREWTYLRKDGKHLTVNLIVTALHYEGRISGFIGIATDITGKKHAEEELHYQNEELQAQQAELEAQQEDLLFTLTKLEESESYLKKRNMLAITLVNTLDKKDLYQSIMDSLIDLFGAQRGIIIILDKLQEFAAFGYSEQEAVALKLSMSQIILPRLNEQKLPFTVKNEETHNLYIPVIDEDMELIACIVLSRLHNPITKSELEEAIGLATQIALSLQKLWLHEESKQQRELMQDMMNTIQEGILLIDLQGNTLQVNTKFCELIGYKAAESGGSFISNGFKEEEEDPFRMNIYWEHLKQIIDDPHLLQTFIRNIILNPIKGSATINYRINSPVKRNINMYYELLYLNGHVFAVLLVHRDVTREYELDQLKSEFVNTVSHELRTPLSSVYGLTELMLTKQLSPEKQHKYLTTIYEETKRLTSLINNFLDLQRMESGRKVYEIICVDIEKIIYKVLDFNKINMENHEVSYQFQDKPLLVMGDEDSLTQIMMNLVSNAIKYSPKGGKIQISAWKEGEYRAISIKDEGLGIPADSLNQLFSKFYRVDNSDRRQIGGTGLGLSIVKEIVTSHKGDIRVSSVYGEGSTFTIRLPIGVNLDEEDLLLRA
ncbi:ATP-binding protein [Paenibacillus psychroresistens]|uniref:ATP-binding protein n=1 Tax=Paenibacillus psychroresistens TaxID=1778678 RepID=UPI00139165EE|nr:ATP-binding protein [Paenibacillus psychroresistens]